MSEPVTIGGQTFINDPDKGWIDRKTKIPADKGLIRLLDSLEIKPVESRLKIKIDRSRDPVFLNGQKFVYDKNSGWIDEKTKTKVPDSLQKILESATKPAIQDMVTATEMVAETFGAVGVVAKQRVRIKQPPVQKNKQATANRIANNKNQLIINTQLVKMITHLSSINSLIQQRKEQDIAVARNVSDQLDEAKIENAAQSDTITANTQDATKQSGPDLFLLAAGGLLIANYIDPIMNVVTTLSDGLYKLGSFTMDVVKAINSAFTFISGGNKESAPTSTPSTPAPAQPEKTESRPDSVDNASSGITVPATPNQPVETPVQPKPEQQPKSRNEAPASAVSKPVKPATSPTATPVSKPTGSPTVTSPTRPSSPVTPSPTPQTPVASKIDGGIFSSDLAVRIKALTDATQTPTPQTPVASKITAGKLSSDPAIRNRAFAEDAKKQPKGNINPSDVLEFTGRSGDQNHFNLLEPETKQAILSAAQEYKQTTGQKLIINSARRTREEQQVLWNNRHTNPNPVAPPGTSNHESGWSVDIGQRGDPTAKSILEKHGMIWFGAGDPVHYTLKGHGEGGGAGGTGGAGGLAGAVGSAINQGIDTVADIIKGMASIVNTKSTPLEGGVASIAKANAGEYTSKSLKMEAAQSERHADMVQATNPPPAPTPTAASLPNLNSNKPDLGIKTPATNDDKRIVYDYLRYFKVLPENSSAPAMVLAK